MPQRMVSRNTLAALNITALIVSCSTALLSYQALTQNRSLRTENDVLWELQDLNASMKDIHQQNLNAMFPDMVTAGRSYLTATERMALEESLEDSHIHEDPWNNLCNIETHSLEGNYSTRGNCVFLSPTLVLTNYHVIQHDNKEEFYDTIKLVLSQGDFYSGKLDLVATSPRYDLALGCVKNPNLNAVRMQIADPTDARPYRYLSLLLGNDGAIGSEEGVLRLEYINTRSYISHSGVFVFPSLEMSGQVEDGYSGSPVFQEGKLVGLIAHKINTNDYIGVSPNVRWFIEETLKRVE